MSKKITLRLCEKKGLKAPPRPDMRGTNACESDDDESEHDVAAEDETAKTPQSQKTPEHSNKPQTSDDGDARPPETSQPSNTVSTSMYIE